MAIGVPKKLVKWVAGAERKRLFGRLFYELIKPSKEDVLLEIGGPSEGAQGVISLFRKILVVNIEDRGMQRCNYPEDAQLVLGDCCLLPLRNNSVDFVFSNAVLEHVPKTHWVFFAQEVARVARKGFLICTPNHYFPFEPHYLMPFFQFIPESIRRKLVVNYGLTIGHMSRANYHQINLPKKSQLQRLFPMAQVRGWGMPLLPIHWVCWSAW